MVDTRFHTAGRPIPLAEAAEIAGARLAEGGDPARPIRGVAPLRIAWPEEASFLDGPRNRPAYDASAAGACFVTAGMARSLDPARNLLVCPAPQAAYVRLARALHPEPAPVPGIGPAAQADPTAELGPGVCVGPGAVIGPGARLGAGASVGAGAVIGPGVVIGENARIGPHVTVTHALIGARVTLHPGVPIGQPGFGYLPGPAGLEPIPQLGRVVVGDDVEIGANSTVDRGAGDDTVIGRGTKIDNLVQVAHNCRIGAHCVLAGQVGLSGSVTLGDGAMLGGQVGVADHVTIGAGARVAAQSGVMRDIPPGATHGGAPARDVRDWMREVALLRSLRRRGAPDRE